MHVRIGISDNRVYELLTDATVAPGAPWSAVTAGLGRYAGWKLSLFYRPDHIVWHFVLSADATSGVPGTVAWALPAITAAPAAAHEYAARRVRLTRNGAP